MKIELRLSNYLCDAARLHPELTQYPRIDLIPPTVPPPILMYL